MLTQVLNLKAKFVSLLGLGRKVPRPVKLMAAELDLNDPVFHRRKLLYVFGFTSTFVYILCSNKDACALMKMHGYSMYDAYEDKKNPEIVWLTPAQAEAVIRTYDEQTYCMNHFLF